MVRMAINLTALISMRLMTWLAIVVIAMPLGSARVTAADDDQNMTLMQMSVSCDHDEAAVMVSPQPDHNAGQNQQPCCEDCDMPDCAAGSAGPVLTILAGTIPEAFLSNTGTPNLLGDLTQNSTNQDTPRKPPRV
jgi:hypothetical protein